MYLIDTSKKEALALEKKTFSELNLSERNDLQEWIANNPEMLGERLLIIQKEFAGFDDTKERLDLLALDENGSLVVIENKLDDSGKDVVWQSLKYVSYCAALRKEEICVIFQAYLGSKCLAEDKLSAFFDEPDYENIKLNPVDSDQRIILVSAKFRKEVTSTVLWLRDHGIDITCIKVTPYKDDGKLYLNVEQLLPIKDIEDYQIKLSAKRQDDIASANNEATHQKLCLKFWEQALPALRAHTGLYQNVSPSKDHWINGNIGIPGIFINPVILKVSARAEIYIDTGDKERNKHIFHCLFAQREKFSSEFPSEVDWQELPERRACRISVTRVGNGLVDEEKWDNIIDFLSETVLKFFEVFRTSLDEAAR